MAATSVTENGTKEEVVDDVSPVEVKPSETVDANKLAALKAKSQAKQQGDKMAAKIVAKRDRSLVFGVLGSGQAGSRLAEAFYKLGIDSLASNT